MKNLCIFNGVIWYAIYRMEDGHFAPFLISGISDFSKACSFAKRMCGPYTLVGVISSEAVDTFF